MDATPKEPAHGLWSPCHRRLCIKPPPRRDVDACVGHELLEQAALFESAGHQVVPAGAYLGNQHSCGRVSPVHGGSWWLRSDASSRVRRPQSRPANRGCSLAHPSCTVGLWLDSGLVAWRRDGAIPGFRPMRLEPSVLAVEFATHGRAHSPTPHTLD